MDFSKRTHPIITNDNKNNHSDWIVAVIRKVSSTSVHSELSVVEVKFTSTKLNFGWKFHSSHQAECLSTLIVVLLLVPSTSMG